MTRVRKSQVKLNGTIVNGVTFYTRKGTTVVRTSHSNQPERRTLKQFVGRARIAHSTTLWRALKRQLQPLFVGGANPYSRFMSLMSQQPVVYLTLDEHREGAALLVPGMPVAEGLLESVKYKLGKVDGQPALITNLPSTIARGATLRLYTLTQSVAADGTPKLNISVEEKSYGRTRGAGAFKGTKVSIVNDHVAYVGDMFADNMKGWALVMIRGERWSTQEVVTRCNLYKRYTTDAALHASAESYGGLTDK